VELRSNASLVHRVDSQWRLATKALIRCLDDGLLALSAEAIAWSG
jgi:hypothetical protein